MNYKDRYECGDIVGVIEVEIPDFLPMKPLKKKIDDLIKEEETRWVLFRRAVDDLDLKEEVFFVLEELREKVWKEEKKSLVSRQLLNVVKYKTY